MVKSSPIFGGIVAFTNKLVKTKEDQIDSHLLSIINEKSCDMLTNDPFSVLNKEKISRLCLSKKLLFLKLVTPIIEVVLKTEPKLRFEVVFDSYLQKVINISSVIVSRLNIEINDKNQWKINVINKLVSQYVCHLDLHKIVYTDESIVEFICGKHAQFELIYDKFTVQDNTNDSIKLRLFFAKLSSNLLTNVLLNNSLQCDPYTTLPIVIEFLIANILNFKNNLLSEIHTAEDNLILLETLCLDTLPVFYHCWKQEEIRVKSIMESLPPNKMNKLLDKYKEFGFPLDSIFTNFSKNINNLLPLLVKLSS